MTEQSKDGSWLNEEDRVVLQRAAWFAVGLGAVFGCTVAADGRKLVLWLPWLALVPLIVLRRHLGLRVVSYLFGTLTPIVVPLAFFALFFWGNELLHERSFDAESWRAQQEYEIEKWTPRQRMVDDLIDGGRLNGLTRAQVLELLGPPVDEDFPHGASSSDIHYHVGQERGFLAIDSEWLLIDFDESGVVEDYGLYTD